MLLIRKMGHPAGSSAKGIKEPKGNPECFLERVDSVPTGARKNRVRARSAWLGSGICGSYGPVDACWRGVAASSDDIDSFATHVRRPLRGATRWGFFWMLLRWTACRLAPPIRIVAVPVEAS